MTAGRELHLVIPGICGPLADIQPLQQHPVINRWTRVLARSSSHSSPSNVHDVIASLFKLTVEDDFPAAALSLLADDSFDATMNVMCADPVHLEADLDHAVLTSSTDLDITEMESAVLCDALNEHFKQDSLSFIRRDSGHWFVVSRNSICLNTTSLADAVGRNVNFLLPEGDSSASWKQVMTEAQMLLHAHAINYERENRGKQSINSLWFHGSGDLPDVLNCPVSSVCSNDGIFKGLAAHVQCDYLPLPASAMEYADVLETANSNRVNVLHLSDLENLVNYTDVTLWLEKLTEILEQWVYPLLKMANSNNINVFLYPCNEKQYQFSKYDALKFWRQGKLEQHVKRY